MHINFTECEHGFHEVSTTVKPHNRHSTCRAVCKNVRMIRGGKTFTNSTAKGIQQIFNGTKLRRVRWPLHTCYSITFRVFIYLRARALSSIVTKVGPTAKAYNLRVGSRTSSQYQTVVTELRVKTCRSRRYPNKYPCPHHDTSTSEWVMFRDVLGPTT